MLPVANRVAGNRFCQRGTEVQLPLHNADDSFFLHGDGWLKRWEIADATDDSCRLRLRSQLACGYDYLAELQYVLEASVLKASLTIAHLGKRPMLYGCGFHPFLLSMCTVRCSFRQAVTGRKVSIICHWPGKATSRRKPISPGRNMARIAG